MMNMCFMVLLFNSEAVILCRRPIILALKLHPEASDENLTFRNSSSPSLVGQLESSLVKISIDAPDYIMIKSLEVTLIDGAVSGVRTLAPGHRYCRTEL